MQITVTRTKRDYLALDLFTRRTSPAQRKIYWAIFGALLAMVLFDIVPHLYQQLGVAALQMYVPLAIFVALIFFHAHWLLVTYGQSWWRIQQQGHTASATISVHVTLTPQGITETQLPSGHTMIMPWAQVRGLYETKRHLFLPLATGASLIFPKRYFAGATDGQRFIECVKHYGATSAAFAYVKENAQQRQTQSLCNATALVLTFSLGGWTLWTVLANLDYVAPPPSLTAPLARFAPKRTHLPDRDSEARMALLRTIGEHMKKRDAAAAAAACQQAIQLNPQQAWPYQTLGYVYQFAHCPVAAQENFERALQREPDSIEAVYGLVALERSRGRTQEAERLLHQLAERSPDNRFVELELASLYEDQHQTEKAAIAYRRVLADSPYGFGGSAHRPLFRMRLQRAQGWFADDETLRRQLLHDEGEDDDESEK